MPQEDAGRRKQYWPQYTFLPDYAAQISQCFCTRPISEPPAGDKLAHLPGFARLLLQLAPDRCKSAGGIEALGVGHETRDQL